MRPSVLAAALLVSACLVAPGPGAYADPATCGDFKYSPWKWSVYARKEVARGLYVSAQAARDHLRLADYNGWTYEEILKTTGQWWGILRVTASY